MIYRITPHRSSVNMKTILTRLKSIKWLALIILLVAAGYWVLDYRQFSTNIRDDKAVKENPMLLTAPVMTDYKNETLNFKLIADKAHVFEEKKQTLLFNLTAYLYEDDGVNLSARIVADQGEYLNKTELLRLWGKVRVELKEGQKLFTEELFVDRKKDLIYNTVKVKAISDSDIVNAASLNYRIKKGILLLRKPRATFKL